jgi:hypothetical protein
MARALRPDLEIIDRCNGTVLQEPGQEGLVDFLQDNRVRVVASFPCYSEDNVNDAGYGMSSSSSFDHDLKLDLVYNPLGAFLPLEQGPLQQQYKQQLEDNFGILFDQLIIMTNMPIKRSADFLLVEMNW